MTRPTCDVCGADEWPIATALTAVVSRVCQDCAERARRWKVIVKFDDPWDDPYHEVNQPFEAHR